jgi:hypothetical protein
MDWGCKKSLIDPQLGPGIFATFLWPFFCSDFEQKDAIELSV